MMLVKFGLLLCVLLLVVCLKSVYRCSKVRLFGCFVSCLMLIWVWLNWVVSLFIGCFCKGFRLVDFNKWIVVWG